MTEHGLLQSGWTFRFDSARRRFGICRFGRKEISVSRHLVALNEEAECFDTVLHEIAHALAGPAAGHGPRWKAACLRIGAKPERCYTSEDVEQPDARFRAVCPSCGVERGFHRRPSRIRACAACCRAKSGGRFDERFVLQVIDTATGDDVGYATPHAAAIGTCPACDRQYVFRKAVRAPRACGACCRTHARGRFDDRFRLVLSRPDQSQ